MGYMCKSNLSLALDHKVASALGFGLAEVMKLKNLKYFVGGRGAAPVFLSLGLECSGEIGASNLGSASAESSNCPEMSLLICEAGKNPLIFFISRS